MNLRLASLFLLAFSTGGFLQADNHNLYPLPEDRGTAGILGALQKLPVHVRVLYTVAHPDDERAATLTWLARKAHARTAIFCLTRGDGGQNVLGDEKYEAMGLVRTGELLEACRLYGIETYFSTVFEFGFSKSAAETFAKWGHEESLEEMVRFIRRFQPAIIISTFGGDTGDGHGHHQAAGILTREAYRAAADPNRFPQHFKEQGLLPWQTKKLYVSAGRGGNSGGAVSVPVGDYDPILGRSYREIGTEGYSKHRSQGNGAAAALPGRSSDYFSLVESTRAGPQNENDFFDSLDLSLTSILEMAGTEKDKVEFLRNDLTEIQKCAEEAIRTYKPFQPATVAGQVAKGLALLREDLAKTGAAALSPANRNRLASSLNQKLEEFQQALSAVLGVHLAARTDDPTVTPGEKVPFTISYFNRGSEPVDLKEVKLQTPQGTIMRLPAGESRSRIAGGESAVFKDALALSLGTPVSEPFWYRKGQNDNRYHTRSTPDPFASYGPPALSVQATYSYGGTEATISAVVSAQAGDPLRGADFVEVQVVPALSVAVKPPVAVIPVAQGSQSREFQVSVLNNNKAGARGTVRLIVPDGWRTEPSEAPFVTTRKGETLTARFNLRTPANITAGSYIIDAVASAAGQEFRRGYRVISYPENWTRNLYSPAHSDAVVFDVKAAPGLTVGYIPGAGDDIPDALEQLGARVEKLSRVDLAFGDLGRFGAIVTGIRAYNVNEDLRANNQRLLRYVEQGGTLIVQYVRPMGRGFGASAPFAFGPYPMGNSDEARITVEDSPVQVLEPRHPLLNSPNRITAADFDGWVQERGLYFMSEWDPHYTALLSGNDPGEPARKGGMLVAQYGKGYYIYSAYAWFRQLPAGVPGAYRIFANMISLGKTR